LADPNVEAPLSLGVALSLPNVGRCGAFISPSLYDAGLEWGFNNFGGFPRCSGYCQLSCEWDT